MPVDPTTPVIEFRDVSYCVGNTQVLIGLNLQVARNETLVLLGRSGSGKTTSLKLINRLVSRDSHQRHPEREARCDSPAPRHWVRDSGRRIVSSFHGRTKHCRGSES